MEDVTIQRAKAAPKLDLKQYLKAKGDTKDLYQHVTKVMSHIIKHCPH